MKDRAYLVAASALHARVLSAHVIRFNPGLIRLGQALTSRTVLSTGLIGKRTSAGLIDSPYLLGIIGDAPKFKRYSFVNHSQDRVLCPRVGAKVGISLLVMAIGEANATGVEVKGAPKVADKLHMGMTARVDRHRLGREKTAHLIIGRGRQDDIVERLR